MMTSQVHPPAPGTTFTTTTTTTNGNINNLKRDVEFESSTSTSSDSDCESTSTSTSSAGAAAHHHHQHHLDATDGGDGDGDTPGGGAGVINRRTEADGDEEDVGTQTKMIHPAHPEKTEEGKISTGIEGVVVGGGGDDGDCRGRRCRQCDILLFDLDGTLYGGDVTTALNAYTQDRILDYLVRTTGTTRDCPKFQAIKTRQQAYAAWRPLILRYNQTVRGLLMDGYDVDVEECNRAIRGGSERFLRRDERLRMVLTSLPQRKMIFTNAPESTARTYLRAMGIGDCFERIFGMDFMGTGCCKPEVEAFEKVLNCIGVDPTDPSAVGRICFFEDNRRNLLRGKEMGMCTVLVARRREDPPGGSAGGNEQIGDDAAAGPAAAAAVLESSSMPLTSQKTRDGEVHDADDHCRREDDPDHVFDAVLEDIGRDLERSMPCLWS